MPRAKYIGLIILFNLALLPWTALFVMRATEMTRAEARTVQSILMLPLDLPGSFLQIKIEILSLTNPLLRTCA